MTTEISLEEYPLETEEVIEFEPVEINGIGTVNYEYALTRGAAERPEDWRLPVVTGTVTRGLDLLTHELELGIYNVWLRIDIGDGRRVVVKIAQFRVV